MLALSSICIVDLKFVQYRYHMVLFSGVYIWYLHMMFIYIGKRVFILLLYFVAYIIQRMYVCYIWNIPWNLYTYELLGEGKLWVGVILVILIRIHWNEIGDFHSRHNAGITLVGCDTVWSCRNLSEFQRNLVPLSSEYGSSWMSVSF